jgi:hypothetical protein
VHHQQRDFIRLAENPTKPLLDINYGLAATHKCVFAAFLNALHESRRLQADRTLRQYEHLIAHLKERIPHELNQNPGGQDCKHHRQLLSLLPQVRWAGSWPWP